MDITTTKISQEEILNHIAWLENEIESCHLFGLPTYHLESDLNSIKELLYPKETVKPKNTAAKYIYSLFYIKRIQV